MLSRYNHTKNGTQRNMILLEVKRAGFMKRLKKLGLEMKNKPVILDISGWQFYLIHLGYLASIQVILYITSNELIFELLRK